MKTFKLLTVLALGVFIYSSCTKDATEISSLATEVRTGATDNTIKVSAERMQHYILNDGNVTANQFNLDYVNDGGDPDYLLTIDNYFEQLTGNNDASFCGDTECPWGNSITLYLSEGSVLEVDTDVLKVTQNNNIYTLVPKMPITTTSTSLGPLQQNLEGVVYFDEDTDSGTPKIKILLHHIVGEQDEGF